MLGPFRLNAPMLPRTRIPPARTIERIAFSIASPETVRSWSSGQLQNGELLKNRDLKPEEGGLFCQKIFGPKENVTCQCGLFKDPIHRGRVCGCGTTVVDERAKRMGHIELAAPVAHIWFYKRSPSYLALALGVSPKELKEVLEFEAQVMVDPKATGMQVGQVLAPAALAKAVNTYGPTAFVTKSGCDGIREALERIDIASEVARLSRMVDMTEHTPKARRIIRRFMLLSSFLSTGFRPELMLLQVLPVQPAAFRDYQLSYEQPASKKSKGKWVARFPDVNYLYQRVIRINARLSKLKDSKADEEELNTEKKRLQESVDQLLDNARTKRPMKNQIQQSAKVRWRARCQREKDLSQSRKAEFANNAQFMTWYDSGNTSLGSAVKLVSLTDPLVGKEGRFRGNLLGKRVNFSARSVIVSGPELRLHQCGLPREMAMALFLPFIVRELTGPDGLLRGSKTQIDYPMAVHELKALVEKGHRQATTALRRMLGSMNSAFIEVWTNVVTNNYKRAVEILAANYEGPVPSQIERAKRWVDENHSAAVEALESLLKRGHPVILNRQPTLHRHSIQAFEPVLVDGDAIQLHPLVCSAYNADFDGDTVAIHVPVSNEAQLEARLLMMANSNLANTGSGKLVLTPTQDIVLGCYYLTYDPLEPEKFSMSEPLFQTSDDVRLAYARRAVRITDRILLVNPDYGRSTMLGDAKAQILKTTVGRAVFNEVFRQGFGCINETVRKERLYQLIDQYRERFGIDASAELLDRIMELGVRMATKAGISIGIDDVLIPPGTAQAIDSAKQRILEPSCDLATPGPGDPVMQADAAAIWKECADQVKDMVRDTLRLDNRRGTQNPLWTMLDSGARGNLEQVAQLCGMRGLITRHDGSIFKRPVCSNFRNGLNIHEMFISTIGARKGQIDTALKTAQAGYFTRLLTHLAHDLIVAEEDCGTVDGIRMAALAGDDKTARALASRVAGRTAAENVVCGSETLLMAGQEVTRALAERIEQAEVHSIKLRSVLTCKSRNGVCAACYGRNLATGLVPRLGDLVGMMAAQALGEPATQLILRTFHLGGVATQLSKSGTTAASLQPDVSKLQSQKQQGFLQAEDIATSLPALWRLFSIRAEGDNGFVTRIAGIVSIVSHGHKERCIWVTNPRSGRREDHWFSNKARILVTDGQEVRKGERLLEDLHSGCDLLLGEHPLQEGQQALIDHAQRLYLANKIEINERHFEVIVRQMCGSVQVLESGDTSLQRCSKVAKGRFEVENERVSAIGGKQAVGKLELQGINRFTTDDASVLATAGFSDPAGALAAAAIMEKVDRLVGLRENLMTGKLMPAGTGFGAYRESESDATTSSPTSANEQVL